MSTEPLGPNEPDLDESALDRELADDDTELSEQ